MANVLYQIISKYDDVDVKVYPGVSAVNYAADKLGAPLNDFAAISLSNILTPLSEIEKKLRLALGWARALGPLGVRGSGDGSVSAVDRKSVV